MYIFGSEKCRTENRNRKYVEEKNSHLCICERFTFSVHQIHSLSYGVPVVYPTKCSYICILSKIIFSDFATPITRANRASYVQHALVSCIYTKTRYKEDMKHTSRLECFDARLHVCKVFYAIVDVHVCE